MSYLDWRRRLTAKGSPTKDESVELKTVGSQLQESENYRIEKLYANFCMQTTERKL